MNPCENSLQTLMRWVGSLIGGAVVVALAVAVVGFLVVSVVTGIYMLLAVAQSIASSKTGSKPMISDQFLILYLYMLAVPFMLLIKAWGYYEAAAEVIDVGAAALTVITIYTAYLALRHKLLPLLMRRSSPAIHSHTAVVLAVVMWPCYGIPLYYLGFPQMVDEIAQSIIGCASVN